AVSGDTAIVGARGKNSDTGAAYIFKRSGTTWSQLQEITASNGVSGDKFGVSVAFNEVLLVGAPYRTLGSVAQAGSAYLYSPYNTATDLSVAMVVDKATVLEGQPLKYTVKVTNMGPNPASGVALVIPMPAGVTFASSVSSRGTYNASDGVWQVGDLPVFVSATLVLTSTANVGALG